MPTLALLAGALGGRGNTDGTGLDVRLSRPAGVATDGTHLFVADTYNHTIRKIVISTGSVTTLVGVPGQACVRLGALPAVINRPGGVAIVPGGRLAISSEGENSILLMSGTPEGQSGPSAGRAP